MPDTERVGVRAELRFTVLRGTIGAATDGEPVALGGPQQRRLLAALLANHDTALSADQLVETVWSHDDAPEGARRTVMSYVSRLRSAIGDEHLVTREHGYELVLDGAHLDAADFELALAEARAADADDAVAAYDRALGFWSGRAFGEDADEWWLQPVAGRLEELRLLALGERAEALIDGGHHQDAVVDLSALVADQPLREQFVALLMRALYLGGRQAEALRAFQAFRDSLADETGLEPSEALVELDQRIARGDPTLAPGSAMAVPGYELAEVIGEGAFGSVYRAVQPSVDREVAVKVVRPELADDPRFVARFEAEAQLVARIEHPHVVPLYDFWRRPGGAFLVFRLLRGGSLSDREEGGPLGLDEATRLMDEVGGALAAAHALGVVHRDVKPANILFDEAGNSYLADFGIAQLDTEREGDADLRSAGSPLYAAPEQLRDAAASPASDQYALAVVVWEALAGRAPFPGSTATEVGRVKLAAAVPPLDGELDGARALGAVLARATAPHPDDRYPTIAEFVAAWHAAGEGGDLIRTTGRPGSVEPAGAVARTVASMGLTGANPYKGLRSFQEADAAQFCGRDDLVARLVDHVGRAGFVTVVGPSGSGKSSLVHAGLVPALRRRGALVVSMVPGPDPTLELRSALRRVATAADEATLDARLRTPGGLAEVARDLTGPGEELVLVVDQFEELWTLATDPAARDHVAGLLAHAADAGAPLRVVATLRADQYDLPLQHPALGPVVSASTFAVTPMTASELQDAIVVPAERVGVRFEPHLVSTMVGDVVSRPGALPLLQFALTELFEQRHHATITAAAYDELGGIGGAIARRAEALYEATPVERRRDVRRLFTQLVTGADDADDLRRRATLEELADVDPAVVEAYRASRLVVTDHHPVTREPTIEVAHEALLREWPRLATWIDEDRDAIRVRRGLAAAAGEWQADPGDESTLLRGTRLAAADDVAGTMALTGGERDFLTASHELADRERRQAEARTAAQARQNRRLRRVLAGTAALLVVALLAGGVAVEQRQRSEREARAATQARILAESERLAPTDRDVSLLLAAEAARREPGVASANALATALLTDQSFLRFEGDDVAARPTVDGQLPADRPAFSPDGDLLAVPDSAVGEVRIVDVLTDEAVRVLPLPARPSGPAMRGVEWLPDDLLVVVRDTDVVAVDATTGAARAPDVDLGGEIADWAVSGDGRRAAVVSDRSGTTTVTVIDLRDGEVVARAPAPCCSAGGPIGPGQIVVGTSARVAWRGDDLYVASGTGTIEQWDPATGRRVRTLGSGFPSPRDLAFMDGDRRLVVGGADAEGELQLMAYDADTGRAVWPSPQPAAGNLVADPRHDAVLVADTYDEGALVRFDLATGSPDRETFDPQTGPACLAVASGDGRYLAAGSCTTARLALWSLAGAGAAIRHVVDSTLPVSGPVVDRDGHHVALSTSADRGPGARVVDLDVAAGALTPVDIPPGYLAGMWYRSDGHAVLVTDDGRFAESTEVVDRPSEPFTVREPIPFVLPGPLGWAVSEGESAVLQVADDPQRLWALPDVQSSAGVPIDYQPGTVGGFVLSPDGERVLVGGTAGVRVYALADGRLLDEPFDGYQLATDRDGSVLAVADLDGTVELRDAATLAPIGAPLAAPPAPGLSLSPDGSVLAVWSTDRRVRFHDVATHAPLGPVFDLGDGSNSDILPDGPSMLVQRDGSIVEIGLDPDAWLEQACRAAGRNLTVEEWATYLGGTPRATCPQWPAPVRSGAAR